VSTDLWSQVHLDTSGDRQFNYSSSGGTVDGPFETRDGLERGPDTDAVRQRWRRAAERRDP
jgi:hypothetical protein